MDFEKIDGALRIARARAQLADEIGVSAASISNWIRWATVLKAKRPSRLSDAGVRQIGS